MPVVSRSTVTAILGLASLRKERIRVRTLSTLPVIFFDGRVVDLPVAVRKRLLDCAHDNIGMGIGRGEDQGLAAGSVRIDVVGQLLGNHPIELGGDHLLVELLDLEADFVGRMGEIDLAGRRVREARAVRPSRKMMPARASAVSIRIGRLMIDQIAVDDRLAGRSR